MIELTRVYACPYSELRIGYHLVSVPSSITSLRGSMGSLWEATCNMQRSHPLSPAHRSSEPAEGLGRSRSCLLVYNATRKHALITGPVRVRASDRTVPRSSPTAPS